MKFLRPLFLIAFSVLTILSCKKDHRVLSSAVQPSNDGVETLPHERYPVSAHIIRHDSIASLNDNFKFLGSNRDGNYGTTGIGLYLNANMSSNIAFPKAARLTKAELVLIPSGDGVYQGNASSPVSYSLFVVDSILDSKRAYYASNKRLHDPSQMIGQTTTTIAGGADAALTITVDPSYGTSILRLADNLDNEKFHAAFKGFYIEASNNNAEGAIYKYDLDNSKGGLFLYYTDTITQKADSFQFTFSGSKSVKFNTVTFDPGNVVSVQWNGDTAQGAQDLYLRGMGITRLKVQIPFLKSLTDSFSYSVNRAEVVFRIVPATSGRYDPPPVLSLLAMDSLGREILTIDQRTTTDVSRYGGSENGLEYKFNIPLHAQAILNGERRNYGFYIVVADPIPPRTARRDNFMDRVVLAGQSSSTPPVLNISYTRLKRD